MFKRLLPVLLALFVPLLLASSALATFGLQRVAVGVNNENGTPDVQAGSHPYSITTTFLLNQYPDNNPSHNNEAQGQGALKEVVARLPPGFVGDPNVVPKCKYVEFINKGQCPFDTAIGIDTTYFHDQKERGVPLETISENSAVFNMEPSPGEPAEFAFMALKTVPVFLSASVRTGEDYGITETTPAISQDLKIFGNKITIWGVPADPSHDALRGESGSSNGCVFEDEGYLGEDGMHSENPLGSGLGPGEIEHEDPQLYGSVCGSRPVDVPVQPLLTNPTSCGVPRTATLTVDSWQEPLGEPILPASETASLPPLQGCGKLDFSPTLDVTPDGTAGSTPTGLNVGVHVPQESTTNPVGLGEADVKSTTVTLPPGVAISPSASDGLQACSDAQIGYKGLNPASGLQEFTPELPSCPLASKIANVRISTPLLEEELVGSVYLAAPQNFAGLPENPFSSLIAMYLVADASKAGVLIKLPGNVSLSETGQITTTFENTPQAPINELKLEFYGTDRAPLTTPALCGTYSTETSFTPWSVEDPAYPSEIKHPGSSFQITSGPVLQEGAAGAQTTPCSWVGGPPLPFAPTLDSGTTNINAGSYSELTTTLGREDGQQNIQSVTLHYPPGLSGLLSGVKLCGEAEANAGTCGPESQIGESIVSVGLGNDPFTVVGGKAYITGPYEGAPFGLSIVNPAKAGPYVLQEGRPVVVRAKIEVNPITSALTVTTNPSGPYAIPHMIEGIPLQIKHVYVNVNRHDFTFNPTNCTPTQVTGTINSDEGASSPVAIPLQVTNCGDLKFAPSFKVSTSGKTSKADGASLTATVVEPSEPAGEANIGRVKVELPKQLPSRLTTLQKACTSAQFEANPAGCPPASFIGHAVVHTQLLPVPLEGPAIFVSHGGEAFPSLEIVLQGDNVTIDLVGATYISPAGITSTTFKTVPDQPFETFSLTLPEGPYSALAANGNLCAPTTTKTVKKKVTVKVKGHKKTITRNVTETKPTTLTMPNEFVAQNGTVIKQTTDISVTGCSKAGPVKKVTKKHKKTRKRGGKKK